MRHFIPYRLEGEFYYQELLDATRWVTCHEFNLPKYDRFQTLIKQDMIDSIIYAVQHDETAADVILRALPGRRLSPNFTQLRGRIESQLRLTRLNANFPKNFRVVVPKLTHTQAYLEAQQELEALRAAANRATSRSAVHQ